VGANRVFLNRIDHVMQLLNDGAGIYLNNNQPGTVIERNVVHDVLKTDAHLTDTFIMGIYLDGWSQGFVVRDNLTYRTGYAGILLNLPGGDNEIANNIFVDGYEYQLVFANASTDSFHHNIVYNQKHSGASLFLQYLIAPGAIGSSDNNLFYSPTDPIFMNQLAAWRAIGYDQDSIVVDPMFADYAHDDFSLQPASPALLPAGSGGIGFRPIDLTGLP
jgi:hypothetical protein